jgi:ADP-ribose pyrophosphatase YjhB (NUDIX family)
LSEEVQWDSGLNAEQFDPHLADRKKHGSGIHTLAACLLQVGDGILLSRRAIPPRIGFWTIPGGYVEDAESAEHGACRELEEEAGVLVPRAQLIAVYEMPQIFQVLLVYTAIVSSCDPRPGPESSEVAVFRSPDTPYSNAAFATDRRTLLRFNGGLIGNAIELGRLHWGPDGHIRLTVQGRQFPIPRGISD